MDAIALLVADHKEVEMLFEDFENATDAQVQAMLAEKVCKCLSVHATVEEELFYPEARQALDQKDQALLDDAEKEHAEAKKMIAEIMQMSTGSELNAKMKELKEAIEHHVSDEEDKMFPKLQQLGMETTQLGTKMEARKMQLKSTLK